MIIFLSQDMNSYRYIVSLRIKHPSQNLNELSENLTQIKGVNSVFVINVGEDRYSEKGQKLDGLYRESFCLIRFSEESINSNTLPLSMYLTDLLQNIKPFSSLIEGLVQRGGAANFFIGLFCDKNCGESFDFNLLKELASYGIGLEFDIYPPDNIENKHH